MAINGVTERADRGPVNGVRDSHGKQPVDYTRFISKQGKRWRPSGIRGLFPFESVPGMISLLAGKPNPVTFPFSTMSVTLSTSPDGSSSNAPITLTLEGETLSAALQYGATAGLPKLVNWIEDLQQHCHSRGDPRTEGWRCSVGSGSQDVLVKAFAAVCDPGDVVLMETPAYSGPIGFLRPMQVEMVEIISDPDGLSPTDLASTLENWSTSAKTSHLPLPKCLYTIPVGSNPTGSSASLERKLAVLSICRKHDILIFEDDAYFHLHFDKPSRAPSYFELEAKEEGEIGRVVRFDSFSKIVSSGLRIGSVTGPSPILDIIDLHTANTNLQVSSTTQAIVLALFDHWGIHGFLEHTDRVAAFYRSQRDLASSAAAKHLRGLAEWAVPVAGMFLWVKLLIAPEPSAAAVNGTPSEGGRDEGDSRDLIGTKAIQNGVLAVPGFVFMPSGRRTPYVRTSFSILSAENADEAFRRLAEVMREYRLEAEKGLVST